MVTRPVLTMPTPTAEDRRPSRRGRRESGRASPSAPSSAAGRRRDLQMTTSVPPPVTRPGPSATGLAHQVQSMAKRSRDIVCRHARRTDTHPGSVETTRIGSRIVKQAGFLADLALERVTDRHQDIARLVIQPGITSPGPVRRSSGSGSHHHRLVDGHGPGPDGRSACEAVDWAVDDRAAADDGGAGDRERAIQDDVTQERQDGPRTGLPQLADRPSRWRTTGSCGHP
jgi:hypothetical protein